MLNLKDQYIKKIQEEIEYCQNVAFTGNIVFQINFKEGGIGNLNETVSQSIKFQDVKVEAK